MKNKTDYKILLSYVKLWAKNKGIYSNIMGYLGGISWAILTAKIYLVFKYNLRMIKILVL